MQGLSDAELDTLLKAEETAPSKVELARANGFDPLFIFLLNSNFDNLFEDSSVEQVVTCKACRERVPRWERKKHFDNHKRAIHGTR